MTTALIYTRISKDRAGDEHGVANQLADCERYAATRGWDVAHRMCDNDLSASNGKRRPAYEETLRLVDRRAVDVVLCWRLDRFVRRVVDLESVITRFERSGVKLAAVTGDLDLGTGPGRLVGRMLSVIAQGEVEAKGERQRLANEASARDGKPRLGCPRPFGWQDDRVTAHPVEGPAVAAAAASVVAGATLSAVCREWDAAGLAPPQARSGRATRGRWTRQSVRAILLSPRIAGLATYRGEPAGAGRWDPLVSEDRWRAVTAVLNGGRKREQGVRTLLGALARCPCGNLVQGTRDYRGHAVYRCNPQTREGRPGPHVARSAPAADTYIAEVVVARLSRADAAALVSPPSGVDVAALRKEASAIRARMADLGADYAAGLIPRSAVRKGAERGERRLAEVDAALAEAGRADVLAPLAAAESAREVWDGLDVSRRRAVVARLMAVTLRPAGRGARGFDPVTVAVRWRDA